jgi:hypothetical protein
MAKDLKYTGLFLLGSILASGIWLASVFPYESIKSQFGFLMALFSVIILILILVFGLPRAGGSGGTMRATKYCLSVLAGGIYTSSAWIFFSSWAVFFPAIAISAGAVFIFSTILIFIGVGRELALHWKDDYSLN